MYTIDLLKGQGVPIRTKPANIVVGVVTLLVPVIISIAILGYYLRNNIDIKVKQKELAGYQANIAGMADIIQLQQAFELEKFMINSSMDEVYSALGIQFQWSGFLELLAKNIPPSMVMTELDARKKFIKRKVPKKDDPQETVEIDDVERTLEIYVSGPPERNSDEDVRDFMDKIRFSKKFASKIQSITVSQEFEQIDDKNFISYQIDCVFKSQL